MVALWVAQNDTQRAAAQLQAKYPRLPLKVLWDFITSSAFDAGNGLDIAMAIINHPSCGMELRSTEADGSMICPVADKEDQVLTFGATPIMIAAHAARPSLVRALVDAGADLWAINGEFGHTVLHIAATNGDTALAEYLILNEADIEALNVDGYSVLDTAAENGHVSIVQSLVDSGALCDTTGEHEWTPLQLAADKGHTQVVKYLLSRGAAVNAEHYLQWTALHLACFGGHTDVVEILVEYGADINVLLLRSTPLHVAACQFTSCIELLLGIGAEIEATDHLGNTPLHEAAKAGHVEPIVALLNNGAYRYARNNANETPRQCASKSVHVEAILILGTS